MCTVLLPPGVNPTAVYKYITEKFIHPKNQRTAYVLTQGEKCELLGLWRGSDADCLLGLRI